MKIDKEKVLSKIDNISKKTQKISVDISSKTKEKILNTKDKISNTLENKSLITQDDMIKLLDSLYNNVLNGFGKKIPSIEEFANDYLLKEKDATVAAEKMIRNQILKCSTSGFLTGLGGIIVLPVSIPVNIGSVLYVQMRMIACTAYMAGYELKSDQVQSLVYACLAGVSVSQVIKKTGVNLGIKVASSAIKKIPGKTLIKINQKVGFRFVTKFGEKGILNLGKIVPGVGAFIGGSLDYIETKVIAKRAYEWFFNGNFTSEIVDDKEEKDI